MKVNLQKEDSLNERLKATWTPVRVVEQGNDCLIFKFTGRTFTLFFISCFISCFISALLGAFLPLLSLYKGIFMSIFTNNPEVFKKYFPFFIMAFMFVQVLIIAYFIYLFLKKINFLFFELRFIGDKLKIINGNSEQEIVLSDDVKFSLEKFYSRTVLYRLKVSYLRDDSVKDISLFNFSNYEGAELVLERINKYLEQNKKLKG